MRKTKFIAIDWSNKADSLAVYDGQQISHTMPEPRKGLVIVTENLPVKYARPYFDMGARIFRCDTHLTAKQRRKLGIEKSHENDVKILYDSFREEPDSFREWIFDHHYARLNDLYVTFKQIQKCRVSMGNRVYAQSLPVVKEFLKELDASEKKLLKQVMEVLKVMPIYTDFLSQVKGVGPAIAGGLLAFTQDVNRFPTQSHLMAYFGLHVVDGEAPRKRTGQKANWHGEARSILLGVFGDSLVKQNTPECRDIYDKEKAKQLPRCEAKFKGKKITKKDGTVGEIPWKLVAERRARRKAVKHFVKRYWQSYKRLGTGTEWRNVLDRQLAETVELSVATEKPKRGRKPKLVVA